MAEKQETVRAWLNRMLSTAMQMREMSDYNLQVTSTQAHTADIITDLKLFIQKIREVLNDISSN